MIKQNPTLKGNFLILFNICLQITNHPHGKSLCENNKEETKMKQLAFPTYRH